MASNGCVRAPSLSRLVILAFTWAVVLARALAPGLAADPQTPRVSAATAYLLPAGSSRHHLVLLEGQYFQPGMQVGLSAQPGGCSGLVPGQLVPEMLTQCMALALFDALKFRSRVTDPSGEVYVCVKSVGRTGAGRGAEAGGAWTHQGNAVVLGVGNRTFPLQSRTEKAAAELLPMLKRSSEEHRRRGLISWDNPMPLPRSKRAVSSMDAVEDSDSERIDEQTDDFASKRVIGALRVEESEREIIYDEKGVALVLADSSVVLRVFGVHLNEQTRVKFTTEAGNLGDSCEEQSTASFKVYNIETFGTSGRATVKFPLPGGEYYYLCVKETNVSHWLHQGSDSWLMVKTYEKPLPFWLQCGLIVLLLILSGLFSGLNLGLMALDRTELKIVCNTGTDKEKKYAKAIEPVRRHGNYLLCSLLLGNVLVNSTLTILLDDLTSGLVAIVGSTFGIVIFGEIIPQAICSRHGLAVGARTVYITKFFMILTFPLSYPISLILDKMLGEEIGNVYNRKRLKELLEVTRDYHDLEKDEVNIISGALELKEKTVVDVMTKIEDVYMLSIDALLDFETVSEIMKQGYSRVPVYENSRSSIVAVLHIKNLAFVDPDDNMPLRSLCQFYHNPYFFVFEDVRLDYMFKEFKEGDKGHMSFVQRVNNEGEGDPFYETIGLVTLEDVIEELIQSEIIDETDIWIDNQRKCRRNIPNTRTDFTCFAETKTHRSVSVSPQLVFATFQYLSTGVDAFSEKFVSERVLRKMLRMNVIHHIKVKSRELAKTDPHSIIYEQGKPADNFVLIIEGRVEVTVGKEDMVFESGPFTYFGSQVLSQTVSVGESPSTPVQTIRSSIQSLDASARVSFIPDYTVRAVTDVYYLRVTRSLYLAAKQATLLEKTHRGNSKNMDQLESEIDKYFQGLEGYNELMAVEQDPNRPLTNTRGSEASISIPSNPVPPVTTIAPQTRRPSILKNSRVPSIPNDVAASPMGRRVSRTGDVMTLVATRDETASSPPPNGMAIVNPSESLPAMKRPQSPPETVTEETKLLGEEGVRKGYRS